MLVLKSDLKKFCSFCQLLACWSSYFCQKKSLGGLQNGQSLPFQVFEAAAASKLWKASNFVKTSVWIVFHQSWKLTKWANLEFSSFCFKAFKSLPFCQKMSLGSFSPSGRLTKQSLRFQVFEVSKFSTFIIFVKRCLWVDFHQAGGLQNEKNLLFQDKNFKTRSLSKLYFRTKVTFFETFKHFRRKLCCRHQRWNI